MDVTPELSATEAKCALAAKMREHFKEHNVVRYAHAAEAWLARQQTMSAATIAAPSPEKAQGLGNNEKEALFKQFIEWQRAKGH